MKKLYSILAVMMAVVGLASCSQDTDPKLNDNTAAIADSFTINAPAFQDQYMLLAEGNTFTLSCSQPDYGFSAVATYSAQVSLTPDFANALEIESVDGTQAYMTFSQYDLAQAICMLSGLTKDSTPEDVEAFLAAPAVPVYFKAVCQIGKIASTRVVSKNYTSLNQVKAFYAIPKPGFIYLVGQPEGWAGPTASNEAHYADWRLFEDDDEIGSRVYHGTFEIEAGKAMFRFYTKLTGWDDDSYGAQVPDEPVEFTFTDGQFVNPIVKGKGAYSFPDWAGGKMDITVDLSAMTVAIRAL